MTLIIAVFLLVCVDTVGLVTEEYPDFQKTLRQLSPNVLFFVFFSLTKRAWREVVQKDCQACSLNREDAMDHGR